MEHKDCYNPEIVSEVKTYRIPFRPEYLLIEGPTQDNGPWSRVDLASAAAPTGRDVKAFRFHLTPEAIALLIKQDPTVDYVTGYHALTIRFDACESGKAMIEVQRAILRKAGQPSPLKTTWTLETAQEFFNVYARHDFGPEVCYDYIPKVRWYQFWRWHITFSDDYCLSRAGELVLIAKMVEELRNG